MSDWSNFEDEALAPINNRVEKQRQAAYTKLPTGSEPGVDWNGTTGELRTGPLKGSPSTWDDLIRQWGMDPDEVEVIEPVRRSSWEAQSPDGVIIMNSYRAQLRQKRVSSTDINDLIEEISSHVPSSVPVPTGDYAFVHINGDLQAGKEGTKGMVDRFLAGIDSGTARLRELRRTGRSIGPVYLPWVGDCIEHVTGNYAMQLHTVELSLTEQIRLVRRLMLKQIQAYAPLTDRLVVPVVPGNHDEAVRGEGGKAVTTFADSFATEIASQVSDILDANPDAYGHVTMVVPDPDSLVLALDVAGTPVGLAHGHQFPRGSDGPMKWWANQAHGMQDIGDTSLLLAGHLHHLVVRQDGKKTFIQIPALDSGSTWFRNTSGKDAPPGIVSLVVGNGGWSDLAVL